MRYMIKTKGRGVRVLLCLESSKNRSVFCHDRAYGYSVYNTLYFDLDNNMVYFFISSIFKFNKK